MLRLTEGGDALYGPLQPSPDTPGNVPAAHAGGRVRTWPVSMLLRSLLRECHRTSSPVSPLTCHSSAEPGSCPTRSHAPSQLRPQRQWWQRHHRDIPEQPGPETPPACQAPVFGFALGGRTWHSVPRRRQHKVLPGAVCVTNGHRGCLGRSSCHPPRPRSASSRTCACSTDPSATCVISQRPSGPMTDTARSLVHSGRDSGLLPAPRHGPPSGTRTTPTSTFS